MSKRMDELAKRSRFRIGDFDVHPDRCAIIKDGKEIDLGQLTMLLLVVLAESNGKVVSRKELLIKVWKNEELDDNPIYKEILELRDKLGDDRSAPRYIKTIRGDGYRTVAPVAFPENYRPLRRQDRTWFKGSPYVGLVAFDETHADVFFGRERMREKVLQAMRAQFETGSRFVLLHGASGSGKTSLLHAGVIPALKRPTSEEDLRALAVAHCNLASAQPGDALGALAAALATWTLGDCPVFPAQPLEELKNVLIERPESIEHIIDEAFRLHTDRRAAEHPLAHLLLVIDHGEKLVDAAPPPPLLYEQFSRALTALCDSERTLTAMIVRGDFYQRLQDALPELMELKGSQGHIDVVRPSPREIEEIISAPAECAGLFFENDPETGDDLDYRLREDARGKPDVLPLLQHTLQQLYKKRDKKKKLLTFSAYHEMGGLEGGIAHRADEVFAKLSPEVQASLDEVLSHLIVVQPDTGAVSGRRPFLDSLDTNAQSLVQVFISARLFASEQEEKRPKFGVAHEALLRQWPKASEWSEKNFRLLKAHADLEIAADRWDANGRKKDHLLNPGTPLIEAIEVSRYKKNSLTQTEKDFIEHSNKQRNFNIRVRRVETIALIFLSIVSAAMAIMAMNSRAETERRGKEAQVLADYMLVPLAEELDRQNDLNLLEGISKQALSYLELRPAEELNHNELVTLAKSYRTIGRVFIKTAMLADAEIALEKAEQKIDIAISRENTSTAALNERGQIVYYLGEVRYKRNDYAGAERYWKLYSEVADALMNIEPDVVKWEIEKSYAMTSLGVLAHERGKYAESIDYYKLSAAKQYKALSKGEGNANLQKDYLDTLSRIADAQQASGLLKEANHDYQHLISEIRRLTDDAPKATSWKRYLANALVRSAQLQVCMGQMEEATPDANEAIRLLEESVKEQPKDKEWLRDLGRARMLAGDISNLLGEYQTRDTHIATALDISNQLLNHADAATEWHRMHSLILLRSALASTISPNRKKDFDTAIQSLEKLHRNYPQEESGATAYASALVARGKFLASTGDHRAAQIDWANASEVLKDRTSSKANPEQVSIFVSAQSLLGNRASVEAQAKWLESIGYRRHTLANAESNRAK